MMRGIPVSPGIALGTARLIVNQRVKLEKGDNRDPMEEKRRLTEALAAAEAQLDQLAALAEAKVGSEQAAIFEAQKMMLADPELVGEVKRKIETEKVNAEYALNETMLMYMELLGQADSDYLRQRVADLKDVAQRVIGILTGEGNKTVETETPAVIVAHDLLPSETVSLDQEKILAFVTVLGGSTSHSAIMARTLGVPAVAGVENALTTIADGDLVAVNGTTGEVVVNPDSATLETYRRLQGEFIAARQELLKWRTVDPVTRDGKQVELAANIGSPRDVAAVLKQGAQGVGLFRTEFLYMDHAQFPTEEEQYAAYSEVLKEIGANPVILRTLDIGGDKQLPYFDFPEELNPFLGYRALRICLDRPDIFKTQLRAVYRASAVGKLKVMFPMITGVDEFRQAKAVAGEVRDQLQAAGIPFNPDVPLGVMIETPAAAMIADRLAEEADFFSIGTNDLIQYTMAIDRTNQKVAHLYQPFHPAILRLLQVIVTAAHNQGKPVGICGEMAANPAIIPLLIGLDLDELSMSPGAILAAKKVICNLDQQECRHLLEEALQLATAGEVEAHVNQWIAAQGGESLL